MRLAGYGVPQLEVAPHRFYYVVALHTQLQIQRYTTFTIQEKRRFTVTAYG